LADYAFDDDSVSESSSNYSFASYGGSDDQEEMFAMISIDLTDEALDEVEILETVAEEDEATDAGCQS